MQLEKKLMKLNWHIHSYHINISDIFSLIINISYNDIFQTKKKQNLNQNILLL